jgi:DedD protein
MSRTQKNEKKIRFQLGWTGLTALVVSCLCVLLWVFILGFWVGQKLVGKGIAQAPDTAVTSFAAPQSKQPLLTPSEMQATKEAGKTMGGKEDQSPAADIPTEAVREEPTAPAVAEIPAAEQAAAPPAERAPEPETAKVAADQAAKPAPQVQAPEKPAPTEKTTTYFVLQIAAYREQERADRECRHWKDKGYPTQVRTVDLGPKKGVWHRVYVGHFRAVDQATAFAKKLSQDEGLKSYVVPLRD